MKYWAQVMTKNDFSAFAAVKLGKEYVAAMPFLRSDSLTATHYLTMKNALAHEVTVPQSVGAVGVSLRGGLAKERKIQSPQSGILRPLTQTFSSRPKVAHKKRLLD